MQNFLTPNTLQFIGGAIAVGIGALLLKGDASGMLLVGAGAAAMANTLKSTGQVIEERKERKAAKSVPPPSSP